MTSQFSSHFFFAHLSQKRIIKISRRSSLSPQNVAPTSFAGLFEDRALFRAQADLCADLNSLVATGNGPESLKKVMQLAPHERPVLLLCIDGPRPLLAALHSPDQFPTKLTDPTEWDNRYFFFRGDQKNGAAPILIELDYTWFDPITITVPSIDAFNKALKKADPVEGVVTPTAQSKFTETLAGQGVWAPQLFCNTLLKRSLTVNAVWEVWRQQAAELPEGSKKNLTSVWSWIRAVGTATGDDARLAFLTAIEPDDLLDNRASHHMA